MLFSTWVHSSPICSILERILSCFRNDRVTLHKKGTLKDEIKGEFTDLSRLESSVVFPNCKRLKKKKNSLDEWKKYNFNKYISSSRTYESYINILSFQILRLDQIRIINLNQTLSSFPPLLTSLSKKVSSIIRLINIKQPKSYR